MKTGLLALFLLALLQPFALGQANHSPPAPAGLPTPTAAPSAALTLGAIPEDQIRELIRKVAENDIENDKEQRDYTYTEHEAQRRLDGKGQVTSNESNTYEVMMLYGENSREVVNSAKERLEEIRPSLPEPASGSQVE